MIGLGWATLYATLVEKYEIETNFKLQKTHDSTIK